MTTTEQSSRLKLPLYTGRQPASICQYAPTCKTFQCFDAVYIYVCIYVYIYIHICVYICICYVCLPSSSLLFLMSYYMNIMCSTKRVHIKLSLLLLMMVITIIIYFIINICHSFQYTYARIVKTLIFILVFLSTLEIELDAASGNTVSAASRSILQRINEFVPVSVHSTIVHPRSSRWEINLFFFSLYFALPF